MNYQKYIATGLGTGYSAIAPGTAGAILGIILLFISNKLLILLNINLVYVSVFDLVAIFLVTLLGVKSIKSVHSKWTHDDNRIVIDEVVGVWIAALFLPVEWEYYLGALILFRFFDITKPLFIKKFDRMQNDWSVMLDDILAGIYALISMHLLKMVL